MHSRGSSRADWSASVGISHTLYHYEGEPVRGVRGVGACGWRPPSLRDATHPQRRGWCAACRPREQAQHYITSPRAAAAAYLAP